ncbi:MAG TPA: RNA polymerase factor sigma-54 [Thermoanaerobaculales bacterium]|nr:RNA polymerase factor sigma-54 [Thermoanaerobaculales bacterium]HQL31129.1 RNA polymerase factor sigma-54 [Thermoanaerobaculales bacterium]
MALEQKLRLKLAQRLVMTPSLQQAIKLLQLSRLELEETLSQEILANPILDVDEPVEEAVAGDEATAAASVDAHTAEEGGGEPAASAEAEAAPVQGEPAGDEREPGVTDETPLPSEQESYADIDVEAFFSDYLGDSRLEGPSLVSFSRDDELPLENVVSAAPGLADHLLWQLRLVDCPQELVEACEFIIGNLDEDGFLGATDEEIQRATGLGDERIGEALAIVRALDPTGVGARSLQECLMLQVDALAEAASEEAELALLARVRVVLAEHWEELLHQRWEKIAAATSCQVADIRPVLDVIQRLEPKPGRGYSKDRSQYIEPDVYVREKDGEYTITLNDDGLPKLRINSAYARMLDGGVADAQVSDYLREKMRNAVWLMKSIDQRQRTIYKVARSIVSFQREFLEHGIEHLRPMVLRQVAEDIGMHESTISRVVSNKYMYTPRGLFAMKFFFHSGVDSAQGENVSSLVVKERIRKLIDAEDPARPLSDSRIMKLLQREGIRLARRTVAKYREEMFLPSSDKRRKAF